jgi:hypothetical protein
VRDETARKLCERFYRPLVKSRARDSREKYDKVKADVDAAKKGLATMKVDAASQGPAIAEKEAAIATLEAEAAVYKGLVQDASLRQTPLV